MGRRQMTVCLDLPFPPSVNSANTVGRGRVFKSRKTKAWREAAGKEIMAQRARQAPVMGHFSSQIILSEKHRKSNMDLDNRAKEIFDLLQSHGLIENDCLNDDISLSWGEAPKGCKVFIWSTQVPFE